MKLISNAKSRLKNMAIPRIMLLGFGIVIFTGGFLLSLPISSATGESTPFIDALFTATSAVAVTGQVIYNTAQHWNYFGKTVIISLIQIGGLGFMTVLVLLMFFVGKKLNIKQRRVVQDSLNLDSVSEASKLVWYVVKFSLVTEAIGAAILSIDFVPRFGLLKGIYFSVFHAISAFCNAGFDLLGDSLYQYQENPIVMLTIAFLIIAGGLGFIVWRDILTYRKNGKLLIHTKFVLITTIGLLVITTVLFAISEHGNGTFAHLSMPSQWMNYFFMAVTPRTAGYVNIDYRMVSQFGVFLTIILMFIGGASGSTAGGVKITTMSVLGLYMINLLRGRETVFSHRAVSVEKIRKSVQSILIGLFFVTVATMILLMTETIPQGFGVEYILMEVFSCFGTVGITMGLTPDLTFIGKVVLMLLMYFGRTGLLTVFWSLNANPKDENIGYPEADIMVA